MVNEARGILIRETKAYESDPAILQSQIQNRKDLMDVSYVIDPKITKRT